MKNRIILGLAVLIALSACTPVKLVGNAAIGVGQVALGAADIVI